MINISCPTKFWAFSQAEQFHRYNLLNGLFTSFAAQKNILIRPFVKRVDKENIPSSLIHTYLPYAYKAKLNLKEDFLLNDEFDRWVAARLRKNKNYSIFIGWAGISIHSILQAKADGKVTILERGSSHIQYQDRVLKEEFRKFNLPFNIDPRVIEKELKEYEAVDYISIPSLFVKRSFIEMGVPERKLFITNYGSPATFRPSDTPKSKRPFRILYFGSMSVRKGIGYLFQALQALSIEYEAWFLGSADAVIQNLLKQYNNPKWKVMGHIEQSQLPSYISQCDIFVLPSIEDGFGMVVPQAIACGVPVITTVNTGAADIIEEGKTGFVVPIRNAEAIKEKIELLAKNDSILNLLKVNCRNKASYVSWDDYGDRYANFIKSITKT